MGLNHLGMVHSRGLGHTTDGQIFINRGLNLCEALARENPREVAYRVAQADILRNLGRSLTDAADFAGSITILTRELALRERLVKEEPSSITYQDGLGHCLFGLSAMEINVRQPAQARDYCGRAAGIYENLVRDHPDVPGYKDKLARARATRASAIGLLGDYGQAIAEVERAVSIAPGDGVTCYNAACCYTNSSVAARRDTKLPATERDRRAESYALRAMELLRQARHGGYFQALARVTNIVQDPDLDPLHDREDFKAFLRELQPPPQAPRSNPR
jgi:tetratricopeptide (TPR) repeat protein